jgi:hypothetical protein
MRSMLLALVAGSLLADGLSAAEPRLARTWTLDNGRAANMTLVRVDGGSVELAHDTGESIIVPIDRLSDEDRRYVADEVNVLWARIVLDTEVMSPLTLQLIELLGNSASGAEGPFAQGPFAQGATPMQMSGRQGLTPARLAEKYGAPARRTMDAGEDKGVDYIVYGPLAIGSKPDDDRVAWLRIDRKLAADGLKKRAQAALGIAATTPEPRTANTTP